MHAVVVRVNIGDVTAAQEELTSRVVPGVRLAPGFQSGVWVGPNGTSGEGLSIVTFDSEANAKNAAEMVSSQLFPATVQLVDVAVRPVSASA
jgi:hypothetical protein